MTTSEPQVFEFNSIYLSGRQLPTLGKLRFASGGIGWKDEKTGKVTTVSRDEMKKVSWQRVSKDFGLRLMLASGRVVRFDGFPEDAIDEVRLCMRRLYDLEMDVRDVSHRGWNWGQTEFQGENLVFSVGGRAAFELPMSEVVNSSMASKTEVTLEMKSLQPDENQKGDQLVEMRFYIPNKENFSNGGVDDEDDHVAVDEASAAQYFYETIKTMADLGVVTGESIAPFSELPFLVPRGRYDVDMFSDFFRMHGKSYDYKILYKNIKFLFLLPRPDDIHILFVIGLDPPIRQGQTRYPFLVLQFMHDQEYEINLNLDAAAADEKFLADHPTIKKSYDGPTAQIVSEIFSLMTSCPLTRPSATFRSKNGSSAIKCSYKANEGHIYPLDTALFFIPKPATHMPYSSIAQISFTRLSQGGSSTFDMKIVLKRGGEFQFGGLYKEEHALFQEFLRMKGVQVKSEMSEEVAGQAFAMVSSSDEDEDKEGGERKVKQKQNVAAAAAPGGVDDDDDEEEDDEDFVADDDSEVGEEFDEQYESSGGSSSGEEEQKGSAGDVDNEEQEVDDDEE